ncbi:hypothetical protein ACOSP7_027116 [Xanthoceras sorbifolium]
MLFQKENCLLSAHLIWTPMESIKDDSSDTSSSQGDNYPGSVTSYSLFHSASLPLQRYQALSTINKNFLHSGTGSVDTRHSRGQSLDIDDGKDAINSCLGTLEVEHTVSRSSSYKSSLIDNPDFSDQTSTSDVFTDYSSESQVTYPFSLDLRFCWTLMELNIATCW